ncbi:MAG: hypothetical protein PsegKO_36320 [Pseudohongiellaceae bacterium]|jgi:hypothetical protein
MKTKYSVIYLATVLLLATGLARADYEAGVSAALSGDYQTALREFTRAAEQGLDLAQYNLAILYFTGRGVEQDFAAAHRWTLAAAEQGHVNAQYNLASLLMDGSGVEPDVEQAIVWFSRAARSGHADAAFVLANLFNDGDRVDRNLVEAHAWASQAVYNQHQQGPALQDALEAQLDAGQLAAARRLFARWQIN